MTLEPAHRRLDDGEDEERRLDELRAQEARLLWRRERGRVKRRLMLPLLIVAFILASVPVWVVGELAHAPLVSVAASVACVGIAVALFRLPYEAPVWGWGPIGEPRAGSWLEPLLDAGYVVLLDRTLPPVVAGLAARSSRAVIDSLLIGPPGVFLVEPARWRGPLVVRDGRVAVGGVDRTLLVEEVRDKALSVAVVLDAGLPRHIPVAPVVCASGRGAGLGATVDAVRILEGGELGRWLTEQPEILDGDTTLRLAALADRRLPVRDPWSPSGGEPFG